MGAERIIERDISNQASGTRADLQDTLASSAEPHPGQRFPRDSTVSLAGSSVMQTLRMQEHPEQE
jgi:hypothetical protein